MKKLFFFPVFLLFSVAFSQTISVGPRLGYSWGNMSRQEDGKLGIKSVLAGGVINFSVNELFSVQLEGYYSKKGGGYGYRLNSVDYAEFYSFKMIEFPFLGKFTLGQDRAKVMLLGGPYLGYVTGGSYQYEDDIDKVYEELKNFTFYDVDGVKTSRLDIGFQLGGGMSVDIGRGKLLTELRFGIGMTEWFKFNTTNSLTNSLKNLNHRTVVISAGYILPIWSKE